MQIRLIQTEVNYKCFHSVWKTFSSVNMLSVQHDSMNVFYSTWWLKDIIFHKSFSLLRGFFQLQSCWFISDRCFERSTYFRFSPRKCLYQSSLLPTYHIYLPTFIFWLRFLYKLSFCDCFTFFFKEMFFKKTQNLSGSIFFQTRLLCFYK